MRVHRLHFRNTLSLNQLMMDHISFLTSLRHEEKGGTSPLHVAANSGHLSQLQLLLVWGADPLVPDASGVRAFDLTHSQGNQMSPRMITALREAPFYLTDRLSHFLCGRKGNHETGQHIALPDSGPPALHSPSNVLHALEDAVFSELVRDVFDEVDRREKNQSLTSAATMTVVPFLPVNPLFSSTRNQGRQKLATLIRHEFNNLLRDILSDFSRRLLSSSGSDMTL